MVDSSFEFGADTNVTMLMPHMHLRGKDFVFRAVYPDGREAGSAQSAALRFQLAVDLSARKRFHHAEGFENRMRRALRQFSE